jgi:hypothetical protein
VKRSHANIPLHFVLSLSVSCDALCWEQTGSAPTRVPRFFSTVPCVQFLCVPCVRAMLGYFLVSVARNLLLHCSSVLRVSREGGKYSLHGKTLRWRIVLCAVTNLLRAAHIFAGTTQCLCPNPRRIRTRV